MPRFKAVETDRRTRQRTGRTVELDAASRDAAISALLESLGVSRDDAHVDPTRTLVEVAAQRWTLVAVADAAPSVPPSLRRAGAKHKSVRD